MYRFLKRIQRVRPATFCSRDTFLLHGNAPAHRAASVCQFFTQKIIITTIYNQPNPPDLYQSDYFLFPELKMKLKGLHFEDDAKILETVTDKLNKVQKEELSAGF
jgi:hypothetical protein